MATSERVQLRRLGSDEVVLGRDFNRLMDHYLGNSGGRQRLWGDDGAEVSLLDGSVTSSNNYARLVRSDIGNHDRVRKSDDTLDVWRMQDAGATLVGAFTQTGNMSITGTLNVTGATTLGSTLAVTGAATLSSTLAVTGAATLSSTLAVTGAATLSSTLTVTGLAAALAAATVGTTLTVGGRATAAEMIVGAAAPAVAEIFRSNGVSRFDALIGAVTHLRFLANNVGVQGFETDLTTVRTMLKMNASNATNLLGGTAGIDIDAARILMKYSGTTRFEIDNTGVAWFGATPVARQAVGAAATDLASVITLANNIRTALRNYNLSS